MVYLADTTVEPRYFELTGETKIDKNIGSSK